MLYYIMCYGLYFIIDRLKNKIYVNTVHNGVKLIKYTSAWHYQHGPWLDLLEWVIV
jgi:hypothetical protein